MLILNLLNYHLEISMFKAMFFFSAGAVFGYCCKHKEDKAKEENSSK
jgi:hypothetical protein